jgi:hypothetical protein
MDSANVDTRWGEIMNVHEISAEIIRQNDAHPARCFLAVQAVAVTSALETDALALAVLGALQADVTRQYRLVVGGVR